MPRGKHERILLLAGGLVLTVALFGACSTDSPTAPVQVPSGPVTLQPVASFTIAADDVDGLTVIFTNLSANATSFLWDFGDGQTSRGISPLHRYAREGTYLVVLTAFNGSLSDSDQQFVTVTDKDPDPDTVPNASFDVVVDDFTAIFRNTSTNATRYEWDFGDGSTSTEVNPTHRYREGTYVVTLVAFGRGGEDSTSAFVTAPELEDPEPQPTPDEDPPPDEAALTDEGG